MTFTLSGWHSTRLSYEIVLFYSFTWWTNLDLISSHGFATTDGLWSSITATASFTTAASEWRHNSHMFSTSCGKAGLSLSFDLELLSAGDYGMPLSFRSCLSRNYSIAQKSTAQALGIKILTLINSICYKHPVHGPNKLFQAYFGKNFCYKTCFRDSALLSSLKGGFARGARYLSPGFFHESF